MIFPSKRRLFAIFIKNDRVLSKKSEQY